jgi:hypothetical protein
MDEIVFEHDRAWHNVVIGGIQMPFVRIGMHKEGVEDEMRDEMRKWNTELRSGVKRLRLLCHPDNLREMDRISLVVSLDTKEGYEKVIRNGVFMFGEHRKTTPYRSRDNLC